MEATPRFLGMLEDIDQNPEPWLADLGRMIHIYALYLLALFREIDAYPLLVRIFSRPGEFAFDLAGDVVTQDLGRILASVSAGDVRGMVALLENEQANEYVRSAAMAGMRSLVDTGQRTREEGMGYFAHLFQTLERKPGATGTDWPMCAPTCGRKRSSRNCAVRIRMAWWTLAASRGRTLNNPWRLVSKAPCNKIS